MANPSARPAGTLGTFAGVFTPSILTILGIILFLRLGYVVGSAGLLTALLIIAIANLISVLTSFSLAAIATNLKVKGGGDYYLISRTLGLEFGGALGLVLFLAQSVSIAFYCIGFGEVVASFFSGAPVILPQLIAAVAVGLLFVLAWLGADLATRFQFGVMGVLFLALVSFYLGGIEHWDSQILLANLRPPAEGPPFWTLFAIFFPAVTGFTQGVSMSGDLKNPGKSLPLGTFSAVLLSIIVYFSVAVLFAAGEPLSKLSSDYSVMADISHWGGLITGGVIAATLSSAMASFLGAPRILQSLAKDKIFSFLGPFAKGSGPTDNPRRGVLLSAVIAGITIALGQLDLIARLVSMFFLISYGLLNYATYYEAQAASPSFRPRFRYYHRYVSLVGFLFCLGAMLAIDSMSGIVAIAILTAVYLYLRSTDIPARWADGRRSHLLQRIRSDLLAVGSDSDHPRDWRPYILAFSDDPERRRTLLEFASLIEGGSGLTTVVRFLTGEGAVMRKARQEAEEELRREIRPYRKDVFCRVVAGGDIRTSLETLLQSFGMGPLRANTILLNWIGDGWDEERRAILYGKYLRGAHRLGCHLVVLSSAEECWEKMAHTISEERRIDVWWRGDAASRLMLLLAYLTTRQEGWSEAKIRLLAINYPEDSAENRQQLQELLDESRIPAEFVLLPSADTDTVVKFAEDTALTFMPFGLKKDEPVDMFGDPAGRLLARLGVTALVLAGQKVDLDAEPEEGSEGGLAVALDALERAERRAALARKEAEEAVRVAEKKMKEIELSGGLFDSSVMKQLKTALQAREKADEAARKVAREESKSVMAAKDLASHGISQGNIDD
ncbi:amino acid permease [Desulfopila aestuarii]|uniref:Transporter, cation-chloride cotransporter (CCC) family n=1 Tax=Desulfopila aestuarii DSM 18488 TaxID=1121416 RepID=A0A1M7XWQ6_9BACT|nr:amino acid permease [Desulfopila aestuarii]SHO43079.1 transporter, cation-chloride cotransporter (CCC) family [Desulfopila aestuarii DSM 18488]